MVWGDFLAKLTNSGTLRFMRDDRQSPAISYLFACGVSVLALLVRLVFAPELFEKATFLPFLLAIFASAWFGGLRFGLLSTALCSLVAIYFLNSPRHIEGFSGSIGLAQFIIFLTWSVIICLVLESLRASRSRAEFNQRQLELEVEQRKKAEQIEREQRERYALVEKATNDGIWDWNVITGEDFLSPRWKALLGFGEEELPNKVDVFLERIHPEDLERVNEAVRLHFEERAPYEVELRLRCKDESYRWFLSRGEGLRNENGTVVRMIGSITDITVRKWSEAEIQRQKDQLTAFFDTASLGLHWVDSKGIIQWANRAELELLGYSAEEYIGRNIAEFHADQTTINDILARLSRGEKLLEYEARLLCKDGSERIVSINSSVHWEEGRFIHTQCFTQDITERKRAAEALEESYQFNQTVLDSLSEHIAVLNREGEIVAVNRAWKQFAVENSVAGDLTGVDLGVNYLQACRAASGHFTGDSQTVIEGIESVLKGSSSVFTLEYPCHTPEQERWFIMSATPLPTSNGGAVIAHLDITARKLVEAELLEKQKQFLTLAESIPQLAWMAGPDGHIHWYNRRWYEYTGTTLEQMEGWGWQSVHAPEVLPQVMEQWQKSIQSGEPFEMVFPLRGADGNYRLFLTRIIPQRNYEGVVVQWFGTNTDIDDVKRVEVALRQSEQRALFLAQASADFAELTDDITTLQKVAAIAVPIFADWCLVDLINPDGTFSNLALNHSDSTKITLARKLLQQYPPQLTDSRWVPFVARTGEAEIAEVIPDSLLAEVACDEEHLQLLKSLGLNSFICVPIQSKGNTLGVLTFITAESGRHYTNDDLLAAQDLGRRAAIAIENAKLYQALQDADRRKDEFLATLAHELRNPLAPIRTGLQVLKLAQNDPQKAEEARAMMGRQLNHLVRLVDDLLDVSRITLGKLELRKELMELATIVHYAVEASQPLIDLHDCNLQISLPATPIYLEVDSTRLTQVISNLLNNATKYSPEGGEIYLTGEVWNNEILLSVRDKGIGIAAQDLPHVFKMFSQLDTSLENAHGGLGIGLALVKGLVEMHGGNIAVFSEGNGKGSEFVVNLPLSEQTIVNNSPHQPIEPETTGVPTYHRILVVDDNVDSSGWLATMFEMMGHKVCTAHDGEDGVAVAAEFRPDIIFLDIGMPRLNGYDAARRIRQESWGKKLLLVALTGWGSERDRWRTKEAGFNCHLVKPVDPDTIEDLLNELVAGKEFKVN